MLAFGPGEDSRGRGIRLGGLLFGWRRRRLFCIGIRGRAAASRLLTATPVGRGGEKGCEAFRNGGIGGCFGSFRDCWRIRSSSRRSLGQETWMILLGKKEGPYRLGRNRKRKNNVCVCVRDVVFQPTNERTNERTNEHTHDTTDSTTYL